ncbi:MAG TPA: glycosyltransferase, partial [Terriglobia bacterium]
MPLLFKIFLALAALLAIQSLVSLRDGYRFLAHVRRSLRASRPDFHPPAAVIVPVKGIEAGFGAYIQSLLTQDYPDFSLIFTLALESDPAHACLTDRLRAYQPAAGRGPRDVKQVIAGISPGRGEKVNNLLGALKEVSSAAQVLVFADADVRLRGDWLRSLVGPLADPAVTVSTGFRWYLPGPTFASRFRAAWDTSIATLLGEHRRNFAWGGSMAIRVADFRRLRVAEGYWAATVSDDYGLTRAVRGAGGW